MLPDVNYEDFTTGQESAQDALLMVRFYLKPREDKAATLKEGRPIFTDREYVEIRVPGKRDAQVCRPATRRDKSRFPRHYEAFKNRTKEPETGTPLAEWPQINRSQVEMLAFIGIKTVEQLSNASDTNIATKMGGFGLKQRAKDWLGSAGTTQLIATNEALKTQVKSLESKVKMLLEKDAEGAPGIPVQAPAQEELQLTDLDEDLGEEVAETEDETAVEPPKSHKRTSKRNK